MIELVVLLSVAGVSALAASHFLNLEGTNKTATRLAGAGCIAVAAVSAMSSLYLNYTEIFYSASLLFGGTVTAVSLYKKNNRFLWTGFMLLLAGILMIAMKSGWFLFFSLAGLATFAYHEYTHDKRLKNVIGSFIK